MNIFYKTNKRKVTFFATSFMLMALALIFAFSFPVASADNGGERIVRDGDYIVIDEKPYDITGSYTLVTADFALLQWRAKGEGTDADVYGRIDNTELNGFAQVYEAIYQKLWTAKAEGDGTSQKVLVSSLLDGSKFTTGTNTNVTSSTVIYKISGNVTLNDEKKISGSGRAIIVAEEGATITFTTSDSKFLVNGTGTLAIQGRNVNTTVTVTAPNASTFSSGAVALDVQGGSLYLQYCNLNDFQYGKDKSSSVICFPNGSNSSKKDNARYLYMSDSWLQNISAKEAPGIFCKAFDPNTNINNAQSRLYINHSQFTNCVTVTGAGNTVGGSAIRSYAADYCNLTVKNSYFTNNRVGGKIIKDDGTIDTSVKAQSGKATGGGAIYWKSVLGSITLINCEFQNNSSTVEGGAIYNMGKMTIQKCRFYNNIALKNGGAIASEPPYTSTHYPSITGNYANKTPQNKQNNLSGTLSLDNQTVLSGNQAKAVGGGIYFNAVTGQIHEDNKIATYTMMLNIQGATISGNTAGTNGGGVGIYLNHGDYTYTTGVTISNDSQITNNTTPGNGGAIWISSNSKCAGNGNQGVSLESGDVKNNTATVFGGAVYIEKGSFEMSGGTISGSETTGSNAKSGGAVYVSSGNVTISGGTISAAKALEYGGAIYVSDGDVKMNDGTIAQCTAQTGGAIYVVGGQVLMRGGYITQNHATNGNGGAIYVTGQTGLEVKVQSGEITGNSATIDGGAICIIGQSSEQIVVQIGVNELHYKIGDDDQLISYDCDHNDDLDGLGKCPVLKNNVSVCEGGAIFISGTKTTELNIYCIEEEGNRGAGNEPNSKETSLSDFLKVEGGSVLISATNTDGNVYYGNSTINSTIHITGGDLLVKGTLSNPALLAPVTVDITVKNGQAQGSYVDERTDDTHSSSHYYNVRYFENYTDPTTEVPSGQYTAYQISANESHTVWGVIYHHSGLTIVGWNTEKDGKGTQFDVSSSITYDNIKDLLGTDNTLQLYAVWAENFYWIKFDPNTNGNSYSGSMGASEKVSFLCAAESTPLPNNAYVNVGMRFIGWSTEANSDVVYQNGESIAALTQEVGKIITFYAKWETCDHNESKDHFQFSKNADNAVTCTCQCTYSVTAALQAPVDATYNESAHNAQFIYSASHDTFSENHVSKFNELNNLIKYWKGNDEAEPINAGSYTATATITDFITISVKFEIAKAVQAPPAKPTFTIDEQNKSLTVDDPKISKTIQYKLVYRTKDGTENISQGWTTERTFAEFDSSWALYYIVAYYEETDNYLKSAEVVSDQKFIFQGSISITIVNGTGIASTLPSKQGDNLALLQSTASEGYYLSSDYTATIESVDLKQNGEMMTREDVEKHFKKYGKDAYEVHPFTVNCSGSIKIVFSGAKPNPTIKSSTSPGECFGTVTNTTTTIAKDFAFTTYFEVNNFDTEVYDHAGLKLEFQRALPENTAIIMIDKSQDTPRYWYTVLTGETSSISLASFLPMGSDINSENRVNPPSGKTLAYQFIVDFSDVETNDLSTLDVTLNTQKTDGLEKDFAPDWDPNPSRVSVDLTTVKPDVTLFTTTENTATVTMNYIGDVSASKWSNKEIALVLTPLVTLPIDATITVVETRGNQAFTTPYAQNVQGNFIITINPATDNFKIILESQLFPSSVEEYLFDMNVYAAYESEAPMNGISLFDESLSLKSLVKAKNSAAILVTKGTPIYNLTTDTIEVTFKVHVSDGYKATYTLMRKHENEYASTGLSDDLKIETTNIKITNLADAFKEEGMYCLVVVIRDASNTAVVTVPYYFIMQK